MNYFKQIWYEMRHQKMMTWVSISGTALSIFLVMAFYMGDKAKTAAVAPESDRDRILTGHYIDLSNEEVGYSMSGGISYETAKRFYEGIEGVEKTVYASGWPETMNVGVRGKKTIPLSVKKTDSGFWRMFDFHFIEGKPFDAATVESGEKRVILTRSVARKIFSDEKVVGREIMMQHVPYVVQGVVEDMSPLLKSTPSDVYMPLGPSDRTDSENHMGNIYAYLLLAPDADVNAIRGEVESRYKRFNIVIEKEKKRLKAIYHGQPYDAQTIAAADYGSNTTPDNESKKNRTYIIYIVLLLLPAINLSSMTRSRLRHRVSEIGVRRAYGASRLSIVNQILGENFIITTAGGFIGLLLSFVFMLTLNNLFFPTDTMLDSVPDANPTLEMLFTWNVFLVALVFCFVLNLLSAFVPAWRASRVEPAVAIARSK